MKIQNLVFKLYNKLCPNAVPIVSRPIACTQTAGNVVYERNNKVIVLLGWGGAKQKSLRRIVQYHNSKGATVVSHVMPIFVLRSMRSYYLSELLVAIAKANGGSDVSVDPIANATATSLHDPADCEIIAHVYSNNGSWCFSDLIRSADAPRFSKVIMDSAPYFNYERKHIWDDVSYAAMVLTSTILRRPQYDHPFVTPALKIMLLPYLSLHRSLEARQYFPSELDMNKYLRDNFPKVPSLFIYSQGDQLVPASAVKCFIEAQRRRSVPITEVEFGEDFVHIGAFFKDSATYTREVEKFLLYKNKDFNWTQRSQISEPHSCGT
jgi:hypothetical protein